MGVPRVYNKRDRNIPTGAVYVGRPTKWGNCFSHQEGTLAKHKCATRKEAVDKYREWILTQPELIKACKLELKGKDLVCWCSPLLCHASVLLEIANQQE